MKSGTAYSIWKASGLKHYPTVLRTVKKLKNKRCVEEITDRMGGRGRLYTPTLFGELTYFILKGEPAQVTRTIALSSPRFQEMVNSKVQGIDEWAHYIARYMLLRIERKEPLNLHDFDDFVKEHVSTYIGEKLFDIDERRARNEILELTKVEWIRDFTIEETEREIQRSRKYIEELGKFKEKLMSK